MNRDLDEFIDYERLLDSQYISKRDCHKKSLFLMAWGIIIFLLACILFIWFIYKIIITII